MRNIDRRAFLGSLLGGVAVVGAGVSLSATDAIAAPLTIDAAAASAVESPVEQAAVRCWWHRGRRVCRRRPVRRVCWWRGGRRICRWR